jgi:gluconate 2-dehydrogenase alpha chain
LPPLADVYGASLFAKAAKELGYHPFSEPASNASRPYTNPYGAQLGPCNFCGYCERFGCYMYAKASPQTTILPVLLKKPNFELRTQSQVLRINLDSSGKRATGVTYIDAQGRTVFSRQISSFFAPINSITPGCCFCRESASRTTLRPALGLSGATIPIR